MAKMYFVVKAVRANSGTSFQPMLAVKHRVPDKLLSAGVAGAELAVSEEPAHQTKLALRFQIMDMNDDFDSPEKVKEYLDGDGATWLGDSIEHAVFEVTLKK